MRVQLQRGAKEPLGLVGVARQQRTTVQRDGLSPGRVARLRPRLELREPGLRELRIARANRGLDAIERVPIDARSLGKGTRVRERGSRVAETQLEDEQRPRR